MSSNRPLYGLVLAGGRSSRMGTDKAALPHPDGLPLARRTHDLLAETGCGSIVLSLRHDQEIPPGFDELPDTIIARDPEGLAHAEAHARTCLSLPCHPQLTDAEVDAVIDAVNSFRG